MVGDLAKKVIPYLIILGLHLIDHNGVYFCKNQTCKSVLKSSFFKVGLYCSFRMGACGVRVGWGGGGVVVSVQSGVGAVSGLFYPCFTT